MDDKTRKFAEHLRQRRKHDDMEHDYMMMHYENTIRSGKYVFKMHVLIIILLLIIGIAKICEMISQGKPVEGNAPPAIKLVVPETLSILELPMSSTE